MLAQTYIQIENQQMRWRKEGKKLGYRGKAENWQVLDESFSPELKRQA